MPLTKYQQKRDFERTREPSGNAQKTKEDKAPIFVIQKHHARNLHYDLRLEIDGVLKSWAVPKEPPTTEGIKRLAVQTENHPLAYADFEGVIGKGLYGAGTVEIWDRGTFKPEKIEDREIIFELDGEKMNGKFALIKLRPTPKFRGENNWRFFKKKTL